MSKADFRALTLGEAADILRERAPTLVLFHRNPDGDAVGSAFALRALLSSLGSPAYCVCADEVPAHLSFLVGDEQASVLAESVPAGFENARVVSVDTASPAQLGTLFERFGARVSLMIDHHGVGTPYADHYIMPDAAATGELIFDLFAEMGVSPVGKAAELLYAAIAADTGSFRYSNTTAATHVRVAKLLEAGIDVATLSRQLFEEKSLLQMKAEHAGFERLKLHDNGKLALITFPLSLSRELGVTGEQLGTLIDVARAVRGVQVAAVIKETDTGVYRVSMRASGEVNVANIAAVFGGGGHVRAAGATIHAPTIEEAEKLLLAAIRGEGI